MVRALVLSILLVTVLYVLANWAYLRALGMPAIAKSQAVAADLLEKAWGTTGATLISLMVAISAITSANATIIVGARCNYALGRDWSVFSFLGRWDEASRHADHRLLVQGGIALLLIGIGAYTRKGLETMVDYTNPVFYFFFTLVGASLIVLRVRDPGTRAAVQSPALSRNADHPLPGCCLSAVEQPRLRTPRIVARSGGAGGRRPGPAVGEVARRRRADLDGHPCERPGG